MCTTLPQNDLPLVLNLNHEQERRENEPRPADHLWHPEHPVHGGPRERVEDGRQGSDACDPEDGGGHELDGGTEEADFFDVVVFEFGEGWEPPAGVVSYVLGGKSCPPEWGVSEVSFEESTRRGGRGADKGHTLSGLLPWLLHRCPAPPRVS